MTNLRQKFFLLGSNGWRDRLHIVVATAAKAIADPSS